MENPLSNSDGVPRIRLTSALKEHAQLPLQPKYAQLSVTATPGNTASATQGS